MSFQKKNCFYKIRVFFSFFFCILLYFFFISWNCLSVESYFRSFILERFIFELSSVYLSLSESAFLSRFSLLWSISKGLLYINVYSYLVFSLSFFVHVFQSYPADGIRILRCLLPFAFPLLDISLGTTRILFLLIFFATCAKSK